MVLLRGQAYNKYPQDSQIIAERNYSVNCKGQYKKESSSNIRRMILWGHTPFYSAPSPQLIYWKMIETLLITGDTLKMTGRTVWAAARKPDAESSSVSGTEENIAKWYRDVSIIQPFLDKENLKAGIAGLRNYFIP